MTYNEFRRMILLFGGAVIVATTLLVVLIYRNPEEAAGQLLFTVILLGAVYYGRQGGIISALVASGIYIVLLIPTILEHGLISTMPLLVFRVVVYLTAGLMGGEICVRIRRILVSLEANTLIDTETRLYNTGYFTRMIQAKIDEYDRYESKFCLVNIRLDLEVLNNMAPAKRTKTLRQLGAAIREDIRLTDEAGRLADNTIGALLPHTPATGGEVAAKRLFSVATRIIGKGDLITYEVLSYPENKEDFEKILPVPTREEEPQFRRHEID